MFHTIDGVHLIALEFGFCKNHNVIIVPNGVKYASSFFCADLILTTNPSYIHCLEPDSRDTVLFHPFGVAGGLSWSVLPELSSISGVLYNISRKEE